MEIWKPLHNFPGYEGSTEGRVKNVRTQHILKPCPDKTGRMLLSLQKNGEQRTVKVHRAIAETFYGERPGLEVLHRDADYSNNRIDNLEWATRSEVVTESYRRGSKRPYQSMPVRVIETGKVYDSITECAADIGCDRSQICKCLAGKYPYVKGYHFMLENN